MFELLSCDVSCDVLGDGGKLGQFHLKGFPRFPSVWHCVTNWVPITMTCDYGLTMPKEDQ